MLHNSSSHREQLSIPTPLADLAEQCRIELLLLDETVTELQNIVQEIRINAARAEDTQSIASLRNRAAAANLSQSFYNGVENILKRIHKYCGVPLPSGDQWHSALAERFTSEHHAEYGLPHILLPDIVAPMTILRRFRHVIMHGYAMNLDWERMKLNVEIIPEVFSPFRTAVEYFLESEFRRYKTP